jgi:hypothetical protein
MSARLKATLSAKLQRKDPGLPVFVVIPDKVVAPWKIGGTTIVEGTANGHCFGRRTIKPWGKGIDAWFVEFTATICKAAGLAVGETIALELWPADSSTPEELDTLISASKGLSRSWSKLTERQRREASEHIRAAKNSSTRERRAKAIADGLRGTQGL